MKVRVFVSSVQKELEDERVIVQNLISTDPFLSSHCVSVLYEYEPASPDAAVDGCIRSLEGCHAYVLIVWREYGAPVGELSMTHREYRRAKELKLPILAFIKGGREAGREVEIQNLLKELEADGFKYERFGNVIDLQREVRAALVKQLEERFRISPSTDEDEIAEHTIQATSAFESQPMTRLPWDQLDQDVVRRLLSVAEGVRPKSLRDEQLLAGAQRRGLIWRDATTGDRFAIAAGTVLLAGDPSAVFPQCRIPADAYRGAEPDGDARDHEDIRGPMPHTIDRAIAFVDRNTRHPMRVIGLNRVRLDEYPVEALREALVNAVAHRDYEDAGRKILMEVFADRVVVSSPGLPPAPITIEKLRRGKYKPCSRNPVLAQCLSFFHRIEERGSGFRRMREHMVNHGLGEPALGANTGYFQVTLRGPGDDLERIKMPAPASPLVTPAAEAQLNERQKKIVALLVQGRRLTSRVCELEFGVSRDTAARDFKVLIKLGIAKMEGRGRSSTYVLSAKA